MEGTQITIMDAWSWTKRALVLFSHSTTDLQTADTKTCWKVWQETESLLTVSGWCVPLLSAFPIYSLIHNKNSIGSISTSLFSSYFLLYFPLLSSPQVLLLLNYCLLRTLFFLPLNYTFWTLFWINLILPCCTNTSPLLSSVPSYLSSGAFSWFCGACHWSLAQASCHSCWWVVGAV